MRGAQCPAPRDQAESRLRPWARRRAITLRPAGRRHAGAEAVAALADELRGLEGALHNLSPCHPGLTMMHRADGCPAGRREGNGHSLRDLAALYEKVGKSTQLCETSIGAMGQMLARKPSRTLIRPNPAFRPSGRAFQGCRKVLLLTLALRHARRNPDLPALDRQFPHHLAQGPHRPGRDRRPRGRGGARPHALERSQIRASDGRGRARRLAQERRFAPAHPAQRHYAT